ncbi:MAG: class I SAM-dependent methyltransferase [Erythrobacter sp.]
MENNNQGVKKHAWENYWTDGRDSGSIGCLPDSTPEIVELQLEFWKSTLSPLPRKARIVDLATGDGGVLQQIQRIRTDLKLTGVDYSSKLPPAPKHIKLRPNVDMEDLPFADASISGFVSRFGVEYGDMERIAAQVEQKLGRGGVFAFMIHHSGSPIHAINKARAEQLSWALNDQQVTAKADAYLRSRQMLGNIVPPGFQATANAAMQKFGRHSVATEFAHAVLQTLTIGIDKPVEVCRSIIGQLTNQSTQEITRIQAMLSASKDDVGMQVVEEQFASAGLQVDARFPMVLKSEDQPIAWAINGKKITP